VFRIEKVNGSRSFCLVLAGSSVGIPVSLEGMIVSAESFSFMIGGVATFSPARIAGGVSVSGDNESVIAFFVVVFSVLSDVV
jgi:hypothetical protein